MANSSLANKKVLIVDDEPDVLDSLEELLDMCTIVRANTYGEANALLFAQDFDIVVLDIMGVDGYQLLETANKKNVVTIILTAQALSPENVKKSYLGGASSYIPKEEMIHIESFLVDVLAAKKAGKNPWTSWYNRLSYFCDEKFNPEWDKDEKAFWEERVCY